jgi:hypothetical protein
LFKKLFRLGREPRQFFANIFLGVIASRRRRHCQTDVSGRLWLW